MRGRTMPKFIIEPGENKLSVNLKIDLSDYCKACQELYENEQALLLAENQAVCSKEIETATITKHEQEKKTIAAELQGVAGALHGIEIKKMLSLQCDMDNPIENQLAKILTEDSNNPLAIESLFNSFIELVKNSIDAMTKRQMTNLGRKQPTQLQMTVALTLYPNKVFITINDNAGGFSKDYLAYFLSAMESHTHDENRLSEKIKYNKYYFGGAGLGLQQLWHLLIDGEIQANFAGRYIKKYIVHKDSTSMSIRNNENVGGAEITLSSPLTPYLPFAKPKDIVTNHKNGLPFVLKPISPQNPLQFHPKFSVFSDQLKPVAPVDKHAADPDDNNCSPNYSPKRMRLIK